MTKILREEILSHLGAGVVLDGDRKKILLTGADPKKGVGFKKALSPLLHQLEGCHSIPNKESKS